ncbi:aspartic peptidase domain-containing protein [Suillus tomentosus]|nr:aspartic peptidase domain-containing protein [Suillus tomentosus]
MPLESHRYPSLVMGSADFWLTSTECTNSTCMSVPRYPLTYANPTFTVNYADGTGASGFVARETVEVANMTVANQTFGVVTSSHITLVSEVSGILALGISRQSEIFVRAASGMLPPRFFLTLAQQGILDYPIFGLSLTRNATGMFTLGAIDVSVNGTQYTPQSTYPGPNDNLLIALLDVGTTGLYGPYQDNLSSKDGATLVLEPTNYIIGPAEGNPDLCLSSPKAAPPSTNGVDWLLGTPFLRTVYSIWSYGINYQEPPMIGFTYTAFSVVKSSLSSKSVTVATTLPNFVLSTPTYTTPPYALNTSVPAIYGEIVTYSPLIGTLAVNATALPQVTGAYTLFVTNSNGAVVTSTYHISQPFVTLGVPPGWNSAASWSILGVGLAITILIMLVAGTCII